jgi:hypothetical protein
LRVTGPEDDGQDDDAEPAEDEADEPTLLVGAVAAGDEGCDPDGIQCRFTKARWRAYDMEFGGDYCVITEVVKIDKRDGKTFFWPEVEA